jgi:mannitol/fructose-specific phosphotransferase system IIA component (Ntr-type)
MDNPDLASFFHEDLYIPNLAAKDKNDTLEQMVDHLVKARGLDYGNVILNTLQEREKLGSTGIGKQVAIPHSRSLGCNDLTVIFARLPKAIKFDAVDKKSVHLVFMILAPYQDKGNRYLPLLGKIVEMVKDNKRRKKLIDTDSFEDFLKILEG